MKKTFKRIAAWALALCMCVSCISGALAAAPEAGEIGVDANAKELSNGTYNVSYKATLTMEEAFAKIVDLNRADSDNLKSLRFTCVLKDALVAQLGAEAGTIDFDITDANGAANGIFIKDTNDTPEIKDGALEVVYKLDPDVVETWKNKEAGVVAPELMKEMVIVNSKSATAAQIKAASPVDNKIPGTAKVVITEVDGKDIPYYAGTKEIEAAEGAYDVKITPYTYSGGGGSVITSYQANIPAMANGKITATPSWASAGAKITLTVTPDAGYRVDSLTVTDKDGKEVKLTKTGDNTYSFTMPNSRVNVKATFVGGIADPAKTGVGALLNADNHIAYMNGDNKGNFRPNANITRAEVAQVFYNLLNNKNVSKASFGDVAADAWYAEAVGTLAGMGIVNGVGKNNFQPNRSITRAEFATIAARFAKASDASFDFNDVAKSHWAYSYISTASAYGWVSGSGANMFEPERAITRAEVATIVNRMLRRLGDETAMDEGHGREWPDVADGHWAAVAIAEATNGHGHEFNDTYTSESWKAE